MQINYEYLIIIQLLYSYNIETVVDILEKKNYFLVNILFHNLNFDRFVDTIDNAIAQHNWFGLL